MTNNANKEANLLTFVKLCVQLQWEHYTCKAWGAIATRNSHDKHFAVEKWTISPTLTQTLLRQVNW